MVSGALRAVDGLNRRNQSFKKSSQINSAAIFFINDTFVSFTVFETF